jgi:hypothetical protein
MANAKISALTSATTPLAGTEVLPIVQGGASTKQVSVANLTAGRAVSALSVTLSSLTSGRVPYATTSGLLTDSANLLYSGADLTVYGLTVGRGAGSVATNVALGGNALTNNSTGGNSTAVGYQAGYNNTSATRVTAIGAQAGYSGTTGSNYSTYVGYQAGYLTTGQGNVCVGDSSGANLTTGSANTFIGANNAVTGSAGQSMTTGSKNTIIGAYTGNQGGLDIRTASNYVVLSDGDGNPRGYFDASGNLIISVGNITQGTAAKGINFTANTPASGMTSQLLNWYEEGTWTPTLGGTSSLTVSSATYVRVGKLVHIETTFTVTLLGTGSTYIITGAPFNPANSTAMIVGYFAFISSAASSLYSYMDSAGQWVVAPLVIPGVTVSVSNAVFATSTIMRVSGSYRV